VRLTVTDNQGLQSSLTQTVGVSSAAPVARFTVACPDLTCTLDASGSSDPDGSVTAYTWTFSDGGTATGVTASHAFAAAGTYGITLTATDNTGGTGSSTQSVDVGPAVTSAIGYVGSSAANKSSTSFSVQVPAAVVDGDQLLLAVTDNNASTATAPSGWQLLGSQLLSSDGTTGTSTVWQRVAQPGDAGTTVSVTLSANARADVTLVAYHGTSSTTPVRASSAAETVNQVGHTTPAATTIPSGAWVVSYWADRSTNTSAWTAPAGEVVRSSTFGAAGTTAHIDALVTDSGSQVAAGSRAGLTATADAPTGKAAMWTLVLTPAGP
jgi:hypothetical protein